MFGIKFIVRLVLFFLLLALMFTGYSIINETDPLQVVRTASDTKTDKKVFSMKPPKPDPKALGYCIIESKDLFSGSVYDYNKKQMNSKMSPIKCSDCNQYES